MDEKFRIDEVEPEFQQAWGVMEFIYWNQEINDILKRDVDGALFSAAYDSINLDNYFERLKVTPFYDWALSGGGIISFGGPAHIADNKFFSVFRDISAVEYDWLSEHPEFNQVLHDIHVEFAEQIIDFILRHAGDLKE